PQGARWDGGPVRPGGPEGSGAPRAGGRMGGLLGGQRVSAAAAAAVKKGASSYGWAAAYQLATRAPVMAAVGFNRSDPSPTLRQFAA
ncbi:glycosyl transferase, partial [Streptomyces sp. URMC 124]